MKNPEEIDNYSYAALAAALKKNQELATEYAEKGLEILRENNFDEEEIKKPSVLCQFGILHALAGDMERSLKFFNRAVSLPTCCEYICTECYEAYYGMGITYAYYGQKEEARRAFNKSIEIKEHNIVCKKIGGNILKRML